MKKVSVLQLGDIHFGEFNEKILVDDKDIGMSSITEKITPRKLQLVIQAASKVIQKKAPSALLLCGDLTSAGDKQVYEECVKYLVTSLSIREFGPEKIHVVPGNHDVDRKLCTNTNDLNLEKFQPLLDIWRKHLGNVIALDNIRSTRNAELQLFSLNSCLGCGEWRQLPKTIRSKLETLLEELKESDSCSKAEEAAIERLDTPMFSHDDIVELNNQIRNLDQELVPLVLAHHNLLPQELQRTQIYTELINSGQFRTSLTSCNRPIVYCHGHIHTDPIECVSNGKNEWSQLICVSAPAITDGFNELIFQFSKCANPLGLEVIPHRIGDNGITHEGSPYRITFSNCGRHRPKEFEHLEACLGGNTKRFNELKQEYTKCDPQSVSDAEFTDLLLEAEWCGAIKIEEKDSKSYHWKLRKGRL